MTQAISNRPIKLIAIDLDGTLLNSQHQISERTEKALNAAIAQGVQIILATGKTFTSGVHIVEKLKLNSPAIFMQGTISYNSDGSLRHQLTLDSSVARQVITFAEDRDYIVAAYSGKRILVRKLHPRVEELTTLYHEPLPEAVGSLQNVLDSLTVNKLLLVKPGDGRAINALRWQLKMQINGAARLVSAGIPDMLEILPTGASKGAALKTLIKDLGVASENVMALGDAENDIEMIQLAGIGVAVGNASQVLKDAADVVVADHNSDGVAEAIERFVLIAEPKPEPTSAGAEPVTKTE
jgi:Cof subfamily protein (haloacid dehalogenase superfamily)